MTVLEMVLAGFAIAWAARAIQSGRTFDHAWIGFVVGVALMLARRTFILGAVLAAVSFAVITLPLARAEWQRLHRRGGDGVRKG